MANIHPFRAIRPVRDKVHLVATRPVYTYKKSILKAKLEENPYTFIRIINPDYGQVTKTRPNSAERFRRIRERFQDFLERKILVQDAKASVYLYRQTKDGHEFVGLIAGAGVEEYIDDKIKKHEATLTSRQSLFTDYLDLVGFNAEPVLLSYPHHPQLEQCYTHIMQQRPEYEYSTTDELKHELWVVDADMEEVLKKHFAGIDATYIADGHHRSASSAALYDRLSAAERKKFPNLSFFLACFMDENRLRILEFNRLIKKLPIAPEVFLTMLEAHFEVRKLSGEQKPACEHEISMNLKGDWYLLRCKPQTVDLSHPVACLDTEILTRFILDPMLGIKDLKTDVNIEFISGNLGLSAISEPIKNAKAELGFVLFPSSMSQVKRVADHQMIMPPKSTWVEPKLRSGLTIYMIRE